MGDHEGGDGCECDKLIAIKEQLAEAEARLAAAEAENKELDAWFQCLSEVEWFDDMQDRIASLEEDCELMWPFYSTYGMGSKGLVKFRPKEK